MLVLKTRKFCPDHLSNNESQAILGKSTVWGSQVVVVEKLEDFDSCFFQEDDHGIWRLTLRKAFFCENDGNRGQQGERPQLKDWGWERLWWRYIRKNGASQSENYS